MKTTSLTLALVLAFAVLALVPLAAQEAASPEAAAVPAASEEDIFGAEATAPSKMSFTATCPGGMPNWSSAH